MGHVSEQKSRIIAHQEEGPLMIVEARETLSDKPELVFRVVLRRVRNIAMRRRGDGRLPFLFQATPPPAVPQGLETLSPGNGKQPSADRGLPAKSRQGFVRCQEHVLSKVLTLMDVACHVDTESNYRPLVSLYKGFQGSRERTGGQGSQYILITGL